MKQIPLNCHHVAIVVSLVRTIIDRKSGVTSKWPDRADASTIMLRGHVHYNYIRHRFVKVDFFEMNSKNNPSPSLAALKAHTHDLQSRLIYLYQVLLEELQARRMRVQFSFTE